jgi:hypothetical protein
MKPLAPRKRIFVFLSDSGMVRCCKKTRVQAIISVRYWALTSWVRRNPIRIYGNSRHYHPYPLCPSPASGAETVVLLVP